MELKKNNWSFYRSMGIYDKQQLQRGFKVYRQVCSICHSLNLFKFKDLELIGYSKEKIKEFCSKDKIYNGINNIGFIKTRIRLPEDNYLSPYINEDVAKLINNGLVPPDLSLISKARSGANNLFSLLTSYFQRSGKKIKIKFLYNFFNPYFDNSVTSMPPPLKNGIVKYNNKLYSELVIQYAKDVSAFLHWVSEPWLNERKKLGFIVLISILIIIFLLYMIINELKNKKYKINKS